MQPRHASGITAARITALLGAFLLAGAGVVALATPAGAAPRHGATGLHDAMLPADSPDAAGPNATGAAPPPGR